MDLKPFIRDVPNFPSAGVMFRDITPLLKNPEAFAYAISQLSKIAAECKPTAIVAVESRGFLFAAPVARELALPLIPIRKPGKLPYKVLSIDYDLEYGQGKLEIHKDALGDGDRVVVIDDVLATGGTALGSAKLIESLGATVVSFLFLIELEFLRGREKLGDYSVSGLVKY